MALKIYEIGWDEEAIFVERVNRFLGTVRLGDTLLSVHVHDPGRLEELLFHGNRVLIKHAMGKKRKTNWDLIAAMSPDGGEWVLVHSGYHRKISERLLISMFPDSKIQAEVQLGHSRIDFMIYDEPPMAVEVKGCTLARDGIALFPDAPTSRGTRHLRELIDFASAGNRAMLLILVFRDAGCFLPNEATDKKFADVFWQAIKKGVIVHPVRLEYGGSAITLRGELPLCRR
jgi:sugar fermentation stimulation protein A